MHMHFCMLVFLFFFSLYYYYFFIAFLGGTWQYCVYPISPPIISLKEEGKKRSEINTYLPLTGPTEDRSVHSCLFCLCLCPLVCLCLFVVDFVLNDGNIRPCTLICSSA